MTKAPLSSIREDGDFAMMRDQRTMGGGGGGGDNPVILLYWYCRTCEKIIVISVVVF